MDDCKAGSIPASGVGQGGSGMNGDGSNETKGLSGENLTRFFSGSPFYVIKTLVSVGSVSKRADLKQASSRYPEQVYDWLCPR